MAMETRNLGRSGLRVSAVGLGCNNFALRLGLEESRAVIHKALDLGVTFFDVADVYGNRGGTEEFLGQILGPRRQDVILATKFGGIMGDTEDMRGGSRRYVMRAIDASLRRLKTDWIDLYQFHRPDDRTPIEDTLGALDDLRRMGKIRYIGNSNVSASQLTEAHFVARELDIEGFVSSQNEYSLFARGIETELLPQMRKYRIGLLPFYPLANGLLSGKYKRGVTASKDFRLGSPNTPWLEQASQRLLTEPKLRAVEELDQFAKQHGCTVLQLAFGWLLSKHSVATVIAGATRPEQVEQNVRAAAWVLPPELVAPLEAIAAKA
jgi:aryl-alcohol dehydrogenase-like predicted oxidoreductase